MEVLNPATGEKIAKVPRGSQADVDSAVRAAKKALVEWLESTPRDRSEALLRLADAIDEHREELARVESQNVGKPQRMARDEMAFCSDNLRFFAGATGSLEGRATGEYLCGYTSMIRREPVGVVGQITPWNYPLLTAVWKVGPALAAGNVIVLKPSEQTPLTTLMLAEYASDVVPAGVLNVYYRRRRTGRRWHRPAPRRPGGRRGFSPAANRSACAASSSNPASSLTSMRPMRSSSTRFSGPW